MNSLDSLRTIQKGQYWTVDSNNKIICIAKPHGLCKTFQIIHFYAVFESAATVIKNSNADNQTYYALLNLASRAKKLESSVSYAQKFYVLPVLVGLGFVAPTIYTRKLAEDFFKKRIILDKEFLFEKVDQQVNVSYEKIRKKFVDQSLKMPEFDKENYELNNLETYHFVWSELISDFRIKTTQNWKSKEIEDHFEVIIELAFVLGIKLFEYLPKAKELHKDNISLEERVTNQMLCPSFYHFFYVLPKTYMDARFQNVYSNFQDFFCELDSKFNIEDAEKFYQPHCRQFYWRMLFLTYFENAKELFDFTRLKELDDRTLASIQPDLDRDYKANPINMPD